MFESFTYCRGLFKPKHWSFGCQVHVELISHMLPCSIPLLMNPFWYFITTHVDTCCIPHGNLSYLSLVVFKTRFSDLQTSPMSQIYSGALTLPALVSSQPPGPQDAIGLHDRFNRNNQVKEQKPGASCEFRGANGNWKKSEKEITVINHLENW